MILKNHYWFLRHGQTTWDHPDLSYPQDNRVSVRLSPEGRKQIEQAGQELKGKEINLILASPFGRTKETAETVAKVLNLPVHFDERLIDVNLGVYHGQPKNNFYRDFSPLAKRFTESPEGGENWQEVQARVQSFLKDTEEKHRGQNILVVGHGDPLWLLAGIMNDWSTEYLLDLNSIKKEYIKKGEWREICPK